MKYTLSKDGKMRATVRAAIRVTKEELADMRARAKADEVSLKTYLVRCLKDGLFAADIADDPTYSNTGENN